ncbi:MAG: hypothetical protein ACRC80_06310, partial [Waterburya sp.]
SVEELHAAALRAVESLKAMITVADTPVVYKTLYEKGEFIILSSKNHIGSQPYDEGYLAYVAFDGDSKWTYAKKTEEYDEYDYEAACEELNQLEAQALGLASISELEAVWAGSPTIGGSPRNVGTVLAIDVVMEVFAKHYYA